MHTSIQTCIAPTSKAPISTHAVCNLIVAISSHSQHTASAFAPVPAPAPAPCVKRSFSPRLFRYRRHVIQTGVRALRGVCRL